MRIKKLSWMFLAIGMITGSCMNNDDIPVSDNPQMIKLAAPILVQSDSTVLELADYLLRPNEIDSLEIDPSLTITFSPDSMQLVIRPVIRDFSKLSVLRIWSGGYSYALLLEKSPKIWYHFTFDPGSKKYKRVQIKGQMNEWNPAAGYLYERDGKWQTDFSLFPGKYQYKLILDGKEVSDPGNSDSVSNGSGGYNSLLTVGNLNSPDIPVLGTAKADGRELTIRLKNHADSIFVFWQNYLLGSSFRKQDTAGFTITVPRKAREFSRSHIRVWAYNKAGVSNEILVPLQDGKVLTDPSDLTRSDQEAMILYFLMVDRFRNGNPGNDAPVKDPEIDPKVNYQGGDLAGIIQAVDDGYFEQLGINTIWISPITQNPLTGFNEYPAPHRKFSGYHGYWPITLTTVDTRFGTPEELQTLVDDAHRKGMNVILDFVSHHAHQDYPLFRQHPDWQTILDLPDGRKNIRHWDEHRLTTWFDVFLPTFDLTKPEVAQLVADSAAFWIKTYKLDGFRHDAAKHVPENYWRTLTGKLNNEVIVPEKRPLYQIGETFGSRELIRSYINPGMLDAQFDFNLYWDIKMTFAADYTSFRDLNYSLQQSFLYYGEHHLMGNITGNQDMARFISYAGGALGFGENSVEAGWKREIGVGDTIGYHRMASLQAFNMTIPGIPVIYYGDEVGMAGGGDPDNRRMMKFNGLNPQEKNLMKITAKLAGLRKTNLALIYGDFKTLKVSDKNFVYLRSYFDKAVIVVFNKERSLKKIVFDLPEQYARSGMSARFGHEVTIENGKATVTLPGNSFEILAN